MQLKRARIRNFRSLRDVDVAFGAHTALIGGNGAGKSSILKAIENFYSMSKTCDADDFFGRDQTQTIEIELTFHQLSELEVAAFEDRLRDGTLVVTRIFDRSSSSGRYHGGVPQIPDFMAIRAHATATPKCAAYNVFRETDPAYAGLPNTDSQAAVDHALLDWEASHPDQLVGLDGRCRNRVACCFSGHVLGGGDLCPGSWIRAPTREGQPADFGGRPSNFPTTPAYSN